MEHLLHAAPGPFSIPPQIKQALQETPPYFASPEFSVVLKEIQPLLQMVMGTRNRVLIGTGSGSLGMQMAVDNFVSQGNMVLVLCTGKYGYNWSEMCSRAKCEVLILPETGPGETISLNRFKACLKYEGHKIKAIYMTHVETTTGVVSPIKEYAFYARKHSDCLLIVDAVSSVMVENLYCDDFDVVISASQKGLNMPPGLFFMTCNERAYARAQEIPFRPFYFDVVNELRRNKDNITTFTPATNLVMALKVVLDHIAKEGKHAILERNQRFATWAFEELTQCYPSFSKYPTYALTALETKDNGKLRNDLREKGIIIGDGVRELKGHIVRIAHMGWALDETKLHALVEIVKHLVKPYP